MQGIEVSPASEHDIEIAFSPDYLQPPDECSLTVEDESDAIKSTAENYLHRIGREKNVNPVLLKQLSVSIARSRQCDMRISEDGEIMAEISLGYIAQASSQWGQIMGAINMEGVSDNENNHGFSAGSDR